MVRGNSTTEACSKAPPAQRQAKSRSLARSSQGGSTTGKANQKSIPQKAVSRENSATKTLKMNRGGKANNPQKHQNGFKDPNYEGLSTGDMIRSAKDKARRRPPMSRVKKCELEKQTLLIMDQMISHVKDFTTKKRYFDYRKISGNIKMFNISPADCKKIWEQFKSKLRGQFKEGNEEMRQCRDEWNEDFSAHHYSSYATRLRIYNKMTTHPEIISDLEKLNKILAEQEKSHIHNEILDLNSNEEKLLPVLEEFERVVRTADGHEELDALDEQVQKLQIDLEENMLNSRESPKRKYQSKEEDEIFDRILNHIYTELSEEYDK